MTSPLRVLPSKTAIMPVSKDLMPRSNDEIERCSRTVYVANIDKKVDRNDVKNFFEQLCGAYGEDIHCIISTCWLCALSGLMIHEALAYYTITVHMLQHLSHINTAWNAAACP